MSEAVRFLGVNCFFILLCLLHCAYQIDLFPLFIINFQHGSQHISAIIMSHSFSGQSFRIGSVCESFSELKYSSLLEHFMFCMFFFSSFLDPFLMEVSDLMEYRHLLFGRLLSLMEKITNLIFSFVNERKYCY